MMDEAREKQTFDVFLSHNSKDKPAVRALAALLSERGIKVWLDEEQLVPGRRWQPLMEEGIKQSRTGVVLIGEDGLGPWEDVEMQVFLQAAVRENKPVIPVLLPGAPEQPQLPAFLALHMWVDLRTGFEKEGLEKLIWGITGEHPSRKSVPVPPSPPVIAVTRLRHGADSLVGREKELARLDAAWHDPKTHVVTIVAWGGVGKTALVVEWMARMARDGWRGAERVFDWSFYSQGASDTATASSDAFIAKAIEFFGDPQMAQSPASPWDKGERLARLVAERRTLLVLDGVEPLQYPPGPVGGKLKDPALEALLKGLAQHNPGLCLVTTREPVADLAPFRDTTSPEWPLEHLSVEAGADLLFQMGVKRAGNARIEADDKELKDAAREVGGHALTLQLLGRYLAKAHNGDVRQRSLVAFQKADAKVQGGHALRMMGAYEKWLEGTAEEGKRQLAVLHLLGLFDRPADAGCITALRKEPVIDGLTEPLIGLDDDDWNWTLSDLRECGLIGVHADESAGANRQSAIDCHPLVREYFGIQLREKKPRAWQEAHRRIYEHLKEVSAYQPDTLEEMTPLLTAVVHGCEAGLHAEAYGDVYVPRIQRWSAEYIVSRLGAFSADLAAVSCFFENLWDEPLRCLGTQDRGNLLNIAGFDLHGLGRLREAIRPMDAAFCDCQRRHDWGNAAISANNISEICLTLGDISQAFQYAQRGVDLADMEMAFPSLTREGPSRFLRRVWMMVVRTAIGRLYRHPKEGSFAHLMQWQRATFELYRLANRESLARALHLAGRMCEAQAAFCKARKMQRSHRSGEQAPHPQTTYMYCDFLVGEARILAYAGKESQAIERLREAKQQLRRTFVGEGSRLLDTALCQLMAGQVHMLLALYSGSSDFAGLELEFDRAVEGLRHAGALHFVPCGLLARAILNRVRSQAKLAEADLAEALEISARGSMKLHEADCHLEYARLYISIARADQARAHCEKAKSLITQTGYHLRDGEVRHLEQLLSQ